MSLRGKVTLVTGSTSGIGLGIAKVLAQAGSSIVVHGSRAGDLPEVTSLLQELGEEYKVSAWYEQCNLARVEEIERMILSISEKTGGVDILVNNAGIQHVSPVTSFPVERWNAIIDINLNAVFHTTRLTLPHMLENNWGRVINIGSTHSLVASPTKAAYVAAKHGVVGFTKTVALETAR
jgi:3-hydroxybutyrate dehydrogenase